MKSLSFILYSWQGNAGCTLLNHQSLIMRGILYSSRDLVASQSSQEWSGQFLDILCNHLHRHWIVLHIPAAFPGISVWIFEDFVDLASVHPQCLHGLSQLESANLKHGLCFLFIRVVWICIECKNSRHVNFLDEIRTKLAGKVCGACIADFRCWSDNICTYTKNIKNHPKTKHARCAFNKK